LAAPLCVAALMAKTMAYGVKFGAEYTFVWVRLVIPYHFADELLQATRLFLYQSA
jgi:hypothetical protein